MDKADAFYKFHDMTWVPTSIIHNSKTKNKECIIGIPIYKSDLTDDEIGSLHQLCNVIKDSFEICLICPTGMDLTLYNKIAEHDGIQLSVLYCSSQYFKGTTTYSYLCETTQFYKCFTKYEYLFIYQLDAWIFRNDLQKYIDLDVDYIGSPWKLGSFRFNQDTVGNGGVSLRRVSKFIQACQKFIPNDFSKEYYNKEDLFFCKTHRIKTGFKYASVRNASNFSITAFGRYFMYRYNDGELPMCVHAWKKEYQYWKKYISVDIGFMKKQEEPIKYEEPNKYEEPFQYEQAQYVEPIKYNEEIEIPKKKIIVKNDYKTKLEIIRLKLKRQEDKIKIIEQQKQTEQKEQKEEMKTTAQSGYANMIASYCGKKIENQQQSVNNINNDKKPINENINNDIKPIQTDNVIKPIQKEEKLYNIKFEPIKFENDILKFICEGLVNAEVSDKERIVITLTTWTKRVNNIHHIIELLMKNTKQPDIININLAIEEFPNKEKDLPIEFQNDIKNNSKIKITWLKNNTKVWKKLIPTVYKYPNDIIISMDDDFEYPSNFIETLYNEYIKQGKKYPISGNRFKYKNIQCHCGCASLTAKRFIEPYFYILNDEIIKYGSDDIFYTYCAKLNNNEYKSSPVEYFLNMKSIQANNAYSTGPGASCNIGKTYEECEKSFKNYQIINDIKNKIQKSLNDAKFKNLKVPIGNSAKNNYIKILEEDYKNFINVLKNNVNNSLTLESKEYSNEKAIISLTSWKARINTVSKTIFNLLVQCPDFHIVLVLSSDEFPKKLDELPEDIKLLLKYKLIEILWVQKNYKAFKKVLFTMNKYRTVPIISADDDCFYLYNYAEKFYQEWEKDKEYFISSWGCKYKNILHTAGCATLYPPYVFKDIALKCLTPEILQKTNQDDDYYSDIKVLLNLTKGKLIGVPQNTYFYHNDEFPLSAELKKLNKKELHDFLSKTIMETYQNLNFQRILVSMTSYTKRIGNVSKSIELLLTKQTLPPNEIHLWLSIEEFPNQEKDLPEDLIKTINMYKNVYLHWLEKNTFVHKRHEIFKYANDNDYVFLLDDDVEYDSNLIKTIMECAKNNENTIILYHNYSNHVYQGKRIIYTPDSKNIMNKKEVNKFRWCGQSMIPAKIYPKEILDEEHQNIRNKLSPVSDECWFQPWVVYYDISLYACTFDWGKDLNNTMNKGINSWSHQKEENGYTRRDNWLNAVLTAYPKLYKKYQELFKYDL